MLTSQTMGLRRAGPGDARRIAEIYVETWRSSYPGMLPDRVLTQMSIERQEAGWRNTLQRQHGAETVLAAGTRRDGIVGFGSCGAARCLGDRFAGEVFTLYVLPDHQGQGHGRALLQACFRCLSIGGRGSAIIWVLAANPSRFFYEAMGGAAVAEREEQLFGSKLPEIGYGWPDLAHPTVLRRSCSGN